MDQGMLPRPLVPGMNMNDPAVRAAVERVLAKGLPLNKVNIAEELAMGGPALQAPITPAMGERRAPAGSIEEKLLLEAERKRRMGPPPGMLPQRP